MTENPVIPKSGAGGALYNKIVDIVSNRTGLPRATVFNRGSKENSDLFGSTLDATAYGEPLFRLLNRVQSSSGKSATASSYWAADKVANLTKKYFPSLINAPTALQWTALERAIQLLETCDIPERIYNRAYDPKISKGDWKRANDRAEDFLNLLDDQAAASKDFGTSGVFQNWGPENKLRCFRIQIDKLIRDEGLSRREAFEKLKSTQPVFWAASLLSFEPEK